MSCRRSAFMQNYIQKCPESSNKILILTQLIPVPFKFKQPLTVLSLPSDPHKNSFQNSRPSSNDSSQSNSNNQLPFAGGLSTSPAAGFSISDVLAQFAKMSQTDRNLLSNLTAAAAAAAAAASSAATATSSTTTHSSSSSHQQQQQQSQQNSVASNLSKNSYPEVTLHPVMNSSSATGSNADQNHSTGSNSGSGANQSQNTSSNANSTNSLLHGILTKSSSRPNAAGFTSFSPTLARLLTAPERMNSQAATVTSGALANLQANTGLNLSKSNSEITITPVVASNLQQSLLAHQQQLQEQQKQLQRLREQHFMSMVSWGPDVCGSWC